MLDVEHFFIRDWVSIWGQVQVMFRYFYNYFGWGMVYYSHKEIYKKIGNDICDTNNLIPDFTITVNEIFK